MGKARPHRDQRAKQRTQDASKTTSRGIKRRQHSQNGKVALPVKTTSSNKGVKSHVQQPTKLKVPFSRHDKVLLIGEGDFSFSLSLLEHQGVASLVATSYDDLQSLVEKYPNVRNTLDILKSPRLATCDEAEGHHDVDKEHVEEWNGFSSEDQSRDESDHDKGVVRPKTNVLHGIDATVLSNKHKKLLDPHAPFTKIVFNFPHTGGLSTDVNRQVRANQELLVGFFNAAKPYLATKSRPAKALPVDAVDEIEYDSEGEEVGGKGVSHALSSGQILVTLFEGEPYTLWNVRDLARHCGLQVIESFKFPWAAYPGYKHARTIGDITTGKDRSEQGKRKGAWRGEERDARCYILALKEEVKGAPVTNRKRKHRDESDDSE
ncbi:hypothetical protein PMZ80_005869 [Knufia obscura]|uniref:25S rRNA (uridine-N(3))-methyltransferase BMT5-like domain-containing protein n=2 Tax=Knufia TaxID=430999 RepID=A0AAN8FAF3_9EURO|nr:hypothetical protein PMZ80_005869 [Knufia obscura]KAK5954536.1 hypothetical protein OHC33_004258 [Knufia fluminis]